MPVVGMSAHFEQKPVIRAMGTPRPGSQLRPTALPRAAQPVSAGASTTREPTTGAIQFNALAAGPRTYGLTGSTAATTGPVDKSGYAERDRKSAVRRRLIGQQFNQPL